MALILSIDIGLTILRAGLVDESGECRVMRKKQIPLCRPASGLAEHDPEELFRSAVELASEVARRNKDEISAIVLSAYPFGLLFLGENYSPLTRIILHTDARAQSTFKRFKEEFDLPALYRQTGCPPSSHYPLARLYYFRQEQPATLSATKFVASTKDYIFLRLTGEFATDPSTGAGTQTMDNRTFEWDAATLERLGLTPAQFPRVVPGLSTAFSLLPAMAREIGLRSNTPVIPGFFDGGAVAIGLAGLERKVGVINLATSAMVRVPQGEPLIDSSPEMRLQPWPIDKETYLNGGGINNGVLPVDWLREKLFDVDLSDHELLESAQNKPPLFCVPSLIGERDSHAGPMGSGVFLGLRPVHSRQDMARSVLEGVAYSLRQLRDTLRASGGEIGEMRIGGTGTAWDVWPHIIADVLNIPITLPKAADINLLGAAMAGFYSLGTYKSLEKAASEMLRAGERIHPDEKRARMYEEYYGFFQSLTRQLEPVFLEHARLRIG